MCGSKRRDHQRTKRNAEPPTWKPGSGNKPENSAYRSFPYNNRKFLSRLKTWPDEPFLTACPGPVLALVRVILRSGTAPCGRSQCRVARFEREPFEVLRCKRGNWDDWFRGAQSRKSPSGPVESLVLGGDG